MKPRFVLRKVYFPLSKYVLVFALFRPVICTFICISLIVYNSSYHTCIAYILRQFLHHILSDICFFLLSLLITSLSSWLQGDHNSPGIKKVLTWLKWPLRSAKVVVIAEKSSRWDLCATYLVNRVELIQIHVAERSFSHCRRRIQFRPHARQMPALNRIYSQVSSQFC